MVRSCTASRQSDQRIDDRLLEHGCGAVHQRPDGIQVGVRGPDVAVPQERPHVVQWDASLEPPGALLPSAIVERMSEPGQSATAEETEVGSYFVANYPPFSAWTSKHVETDALPALATKPVDTPLGLYLHIPFCRKRCHFCYFRVYTDKNASEVQAYLDVLAREWELYAAQPAIAGRPLDFVYFGGGTPSFLSVRQLDSLVARLTATTPWSTAEEVTFECEPGTLTEQKLAAIRRLGVTRLSLGVENFDDHILELNGRAHRSAEIFRAYTYARSIEFPQINIDLIAGMLGETDENWNQCINRTLELEPDSKRRWLEQAFAEFESAGYTIASAYTAVKDPSVTKFIYRDRLWQGADLAGLGVASFGHINGVHIQNLDSWGPYAAAVKEDRLPLHRAYRPTDEERLIREVVLQLKLGSIRSSYFRQKYGVDIEARFSEALNSLRADGFVAGANGDRLSLTRDGLLRIDSLLPRFFLQQHADIRYT